MRGAKDFLKDPIQNFKLANHNFVTSEIQEFSTKIFQIFSFSYYLKSIINFIYSGKQQ